MGGTLTQVALAEWESCRLDVGVCLSPADRELLATITGAHNARLVVDELIDGIRITAKSWVGVVRLSQIEIRIVPKLAGGQDGLLRLLEFSAGLDSLRRHATTHTFHAEGSTLFDLIALLFAEAAEKIVRGGLLADYVEHEDDLPALRGRLRIREQLLNRFGQVDRLECRFDEQTTNTPDNRMILAALIVAARRVSHGPTAARIRRLLHLFEEACVLDEFDLRSARASLSYHRLNGHYRRAHQLALILLDGLGIEDLYARGDVHRFAFLLDMNRLFEDFIARWVGLLLIGTSHQATAQRRDRSILWNADSDRPHGTIIPDLLIDAPGLAGSLPVDAKYKLYDNGDISNADVFQTFCYAQAYDLAQGDAVPSAVILFPSERSAPPTHRLQIRTAGGRVQATIFAVGIEISAALAEATTNRVGPGGERVRGFLTRAV